MKAPTGDRWLMKIKLRPLMGDRFTPTKFPDIGAAEFFTPSGQTSVLVESAQSMANRLESAVWNSLSQELVEPLLGMPYIRRHHPEHGLVTSITEPHRMASAYLFPSLERAFLSELGPRKGDWQLSQLARATFKLDPGSLLHGAFFLKLKPVARLTRLLHSFIEASDASIASLGGVKTNRLDPSGPVTQGMGMVPFATTDYTSDNIALHVNLDLLLLRSYGLSQQAQDFLVILSAYKVRRFLDHGLRLRSACEFEVAGIEIRQPEDFPLPSQEELAESLRASVATLRASGEFGEPLVFQE